MNGERLSGDEAAAYSLYMRGRLTEAWQVFYQQQNGMIEPEVAHALLARLANRSHYGHSLFRAIWQHELKEGFPPEFQRYVEAQMREDSL